MRVTIGRKLAFAFGAIVLVMLAMAWLSLRAGSQASEGIARVGERTDDIKLAATTVQHVLLARSTVNQYLITGDQATLAEWEGQRTHLAGLMEEADRAFRGGERERLTDRTAARSVDSTHPSMKSLI